VNIPSSLTWTDAKNQAAQLPAPVAGYSTYLATITSTDEEAFIASIVPTSTFTTSWAKWGPWIGAYQDRNDPSYSEPSGGWKWITGEPWGYANWFPGEPNNAGGSEDYIHLASYDGGSSIIWNDYPNDPIPYWGPNNGAPGYVAEASPSINTVRVASTPQYLSSWVFSNGVGPADVINSDFGIFPGNPSAPIYAINGTLYSPWVPTDPNFNGYWTATYTFNISNLDTSAPQSISISSSAIDDRGVFLLNGQPLFATGLGGAPGTGPFQYDPNGPYLPVAFNYVTGSFSGSGSYLVNGVNTLKVVINNTGSGIPGGIFPYGPTYFNVDATFTFNGLR
jgi:hypothetical protein